MPRLLSRLLGHLLLFLLLAPLLPQTALADTELQVKLDVAGRQRMLSQRMMRAMCNAGLGIDAMANKKILLTSEFTFKSSLKALKDGGGPAEFSPETGTEALATLARIEEIWSQFETGIDRFNTGTLTDYDDYAALSDLSLELLKASNALVQQLDARYKAQATNTDPALGRMINIAGRQRMLIQKAGKEVCLLQMADTAPGAPDQLAQLQQTLALFNSSAFGLTFSSTVMQLPPPPTADIELDNFNHWQEWSSLITLFEAAQVERLDPMELHEISVSVEFFLKALNTTVGRYAAL
ncbi:type IV pili methyl-accepting chemotaxis transducer N-terminal domain-containing protein [Celeribacter ethanolicus]|uniref:type IV pili methyl-accepting chemotaxis transducer N-terminal domain-containing protein n=1 Tax=Celeribacter ethanolicus TaxID=1758178 RepID=UPI00082F106D|nr:type IV pili methyl-accepting chemotaxis transducer N-terminal domain-containing protein [Celeribacter ethanolicus]